VRIASLWRYPVKSMRGERRERLTLTEIGINGDRHFGVLDLASGTIVSAKKDGRLLEGRAMLAGVELTIRLPTGETVLGLGSGVDAALSAWLGRRVELVEARTVGHGTYEIPADFEDDDSEAVRWEGPAGSFVDSKPIHVLTSASLRTLAAERPDLHWEPARFRPNVIIDSDADDCVEQSWIGRHLMAGDVELEVVKPCSRCVMTTRPQPSGLERELDILRHINSNHAGSVGVLARAVRTGALEAGQPVRLLPEGP
jgi:uncharacterized protein YcbX